MIAPPKLEEQRQLHIGRLGAILHQQLGEVHVKICLDGAIERLLEGHLHLHRLALLEQLGVPQHRRGDVDAAPSHDELQQPRVRLLLLEARDHRRNPVTVRRVHVLERSLLLHVEPEDTFGADFLLLEDLPRLSTVMRRRLQVLWQRLQRQHRAKLAPAVEVISSGLQPRVVRVARVIDIAAVDDPGLGAVEQLLQLRRKVLLRVAIDLAVDVFGVGQLRYEALVHLLVPHCASVRHPPRDGELAGVLAVDCHHLQVAILRVVPRHDRVGRVVGPPPAEEPAPSHARAATRVERRASRLVKLDGPLEGLALLESGHVARLRRVRPALVLLILPLPLDDVRVELDWPVHGGFRPLARPRHEMVGHLHALALVQLVVVATRHRMRSHLLLDLVDPVAVRRVQVAVAMLRADVDIEPRHLRGVISRPELQHRA